MEPLLKPLVALIAIAVLAKVAVGTNYTVGGSTGSWGLSTDYMAWSKSLTFRPGDFLIFNYDDAQHDVAEVTKANYDACSDAKPIYYDMSGHTVIQLKEPGTRYFICTVPLHCSMSGMKLAINVVSKSGSVYTSSTQITPRSEAKPPATPSVTPTTSTTPSSAPPPRSVTKPPAAPSITPVSPAAPSVPPPAASPADYDALFAASVPTTYPDDEIESAVSKVSVRTSAFIFVGLLMLVVF